MDIQRRGKTFGVWTIFIGFFALYFLQPQARAESWRIQTVDAPRQFSDLTSRSIAVDSGGKPHIAYGQDHLYHTYYDGSTWRQEVADASPQVGKHASIAIDAAGRFHISYYDAAGGDLKYATNRSGKWTAATVDSSGNVGTYTAIALDGAGNVHISYYDATNLDLKYATDASGAWVAETVDSADNVGQYSAIAIDSSDKVHISYYDATNFDLKYVSGQSAAWGIPATLDSAGNVGQYSAMAIDGADSLYISYYDSTNGDLKYATTDAFGAWTAVPVDTIGNVGKYTSIALAVDPLGHTVVYISYYCTGCGLKFATNDTPTGMWDSGLIDPGSNVGSYSAVALSVNLFGDPVVHISYVDSTHNKLKYITNPFLAPTVIDSAADVGRYSALAMDRMGAAHIAYYDVLNKNLKYATKVSGAWVASIVDDVGDVGRFAAIAVDSSNSVHISYFDLDNDYLKYATNATGSWVKSTVDSTGNIGSYTAIALDESDKVHISYYDSSNGDLKYAASDGSGGWDIETVDNGADVGWDTAIAVDGTGKVHISYYDVTNGDLKYVTRAKGDDVWSVPMVVDGNLDDVGRYSSIAVDGTGQVHISYFDFANGDLKYATDQTGVWVAGTVDSDGVVGSYTAIAVDGAGRVHISYYDETNGDLKYATKTKGAAVWSTSVVDGGLDVGSYSAIALGSVHISYYDATNGDLKYAVPAPPAAAGGGGGGGCFIATAAYGSDMAHHVMLLKEFRDTYFLPSRLGRKLVNTYYQYSPRMAAFISKHDILRSVTRMGLLPLVAASYAALKLGPIITLASFFVFVAVLLALLCVIRQPCGPATWSAVKRK